MDRATPHHAPRGTQSRNGSVALVCVAIAAGMLGLAYASVPLYRLFCQVTGFGGTTQRAARPASEILERTVTVRFDANVGPGLSWDFAPVERTMTVRLGENAMATYRATNRSDRATVGSATFNVTPDQAGVFFNKLECFCFTEQKLEPGQSVDMPVSFFVDPAMATDRDGAHIGLITLSYTFFPVDAPRVVDTAKTATTGANRGL
jgi:cytochrome c oxidase assembly protein subunit 11